MRRFGIPALGARATGGLLLVGWVLSFIHEASGAGVPLRWRWSNPRPHGGNIVDMGYSPGIGVAVQVAFLRERAGTPASTIGAGVPIARIVGSEG